MSLLARRIMFPAGVLASAASFGLSSRQIAWAQEARGSAAAEPSLDVGALDKSVAACDDFYQFACGGWIQKTEIPADKAGWSRGFYAVQKRNEELLKSELEARAAKPPADSEGVLLGDYYAACMDEDKVESASVATLNRRLATIDAVKDMKSLALQVARAHLESADPFFGFGPSQDLKDSSQMIGEADQGGLTLPDRDYYLSSKSKMPEIRKLYIEHVEKVLVLAGASEAAAKHEAQIILKVETALAKASLDRVKRRDPRNVYHRLERKGLMKLTPTFPWDVYFTTLGVANISAMNVAVPDFFKGLEALLKRSKLQDLKTYLRWQLLTRSSSALAKRFVDEDFRFAARALTGAKELPPRWKRCVGSTLHALGQPLGRVFVGKTFGAASKADAALMIRGIESALQDELKGLSWMDEPTRQEALGKLEKVVNHVGYPDKWRDYSGLKLTRQSYLGNVLAASEFNARYELAKIGKPVDRAEWYMPPSAVNAYYSSDNNKMVFPAGILQTPFYDHAAEPAVNYGGIGMVMGHELTHGFDDQGRRFDAGGNMRDWWSKEVGTEFERRAACLQKQYDGYVALDDMHVNGALTLGENIADQGGLKLAYQAWLKKTGGQGPEAAGLSAKQQFFVGFAQVWCAKMRPEMQRVLITTDPHSPPRFRVNGPVTNFEEFQAAFQCKDGAAMAPKERCKVW